MILKIHSGSSGRRDAENRSATSLPGTGMNEPVSRFENRFKRHEESGKADNLLFYRKNFSNLG
jgi:hypothetical protein